MFLLPPPLLFTPFTLGIFISINSATVQPLITRACKCFARLLEIDHNAYGPEYFSILFCFYLHTTTLIFFYLDIICKDHSFNLTFLAGISLFLRLLPIPLKIDSTIVLPLPLGFGKIVIDWKIPLP